MLWIVILPYAVSLAGIASNQLCLIANHDKFPVLMNERNRSEMQPDVNGMLDKTHCVMTKETHLNMLGDILDFHTAWLSVGDLLIEAGEWLDTFCLFVWVALIVRRMTYERQTAG